MEFNISIQPKKIIDCQFGITLYSSKVYKARQSKKAGFWDVECYVSGGPTVSISKKLVSEVKTGTDDASPLTVEVSPVYVRWLLRTAPEMKNIKPEDMQKELTEYVNGVLLNHKDSWDQLGD